VRSFVSILPSEKATAMLEWIVLNTVSATILAGFVLILDRFRRLRPATRHALWLVVLLKLLTPPIIHWPWPLPCVSLAEAPAEEPLPAPLVASEPAGEEDDTALPLERLELLLAEVPREAVSTPEPIREVPVPPREIDWRDVAVAFWVGGGVIVLLIQVRRILRFRRLVAHARRGPAWLTELVAEVAGSLGMRPPPVRVLPGIGSPVVWGFGPARLLWPQGLENRLSPEGCEAVLIHELAHLRRRDHWVGWLLLASGCVWWWHPLFRFVRRQLGREAELACDAWVVGTLPEARRVYAEALLEVSLWVSRLAAPAPALGAAGSRLDFERRLVMVMRDEVPCRLSRHVLVAVGLLALLVIPAWTLGQQPSRTPAAAEPPSVTEKPDKPEGEKRTTKLSDREKKLQELEKKLKELLKEIHELRGDSTLDSSNSDAGISGSRKHDESSAPGVRAFTTYREVRTGDKVYYEPVTAYQYVPMHRGSEEKTTEVVLTRATYKLKPAKAEALGAFLREHVKATVMETKVEGENLIVTTTPESQRTIAQFIALVQGKSKEERPAPSTTPAPKRDSVSEPNSTPPAAPPASTPACPNMAPQLPALPVAPPIPAPGTEPPPPAPVPPSSAPPAPAPGTEAPPAPGLPSVTPPTPATGAPASPPR
jgi:beta-lactamase regulating signal transducer with metallopeptidase domain